jgi:hypothetical protein
MNLEFKESDEVSFHCNIFGSVVGKIKRIIVCLSNGQRHAVVESADGEFTEPLVNLVKI